MSYVHLSGWAMIFFGGLWAGGILIFAVERTNIWHRMPVEQYAVDFRRSVRRVDPMMPILGGIAAVAGIVFAWNTRGAEQAAALAGVVLMALVIVGSILIAEPINSKFRRLPEGGVPDGALALRERWRTFHAVRTAVALATFACFAAATCL